MKEEERKNRKKPWDKSRKKKGIWPKRGGRNNQFESEDGIFRPVKKQRKNDRVDWQELLMEEEEYDIENG